MPKETVFTAKSEGIVGICYALFCAVLLPWSLFSFAIGESGFALGLLIIYVIVTAVRKIAEPKVLGDGLGVHPLLSLAFMTVCGMLFGFIGLLLSPLCAYLFSEFIKKRAKSKKM